MTKKKRTYDDDPEPFRCKTCNVPLVEHTGLYGTCAKLQEALAKLRAATTALQLLRLKAQASGIAMDAKFVVDLCDIELKGMPCQQ